MSELNMGLLFFFIGLLVLMGLLFVYTLKLEKMIRRLDRKLYEHLRHDHEGLYWYSPDGDTKGEPMWIDRTVYRGRPPV